MVRNLALAVATLAVAPAAAGGPQMRFDVQEPFQVGTRYYDSGTISVRGVGVPSPSSSLIEVWVDGSCLGGFEATRSAGAGVSHRDEALFRRGDDGLLVMVGFHVAGEQAATFRFEPEHSITPAGSTLAEARTPTSRR